MIFNNALLISAIFLHNKYLHFNTLSTFYTQFLLVMGYFYAVVVVHLDKWSNIENIRSNSSYVFPGKLLLSLITKHFSAI